MSTYIKARSVAIASILLCMHGFARQGDPVQSWIRINQLGYTPAGIKVAVWCSKTSQPLTGFELVDRSNGKKVYEGAAGKAFGAYGPFTQTYRLDFSSFRKPGRYVLKAGGAVSPEIRIGEDVYKGTADFCLRYMRQQRSGFNPFLKDSCHTHDGYTMYGPMPDSTHIDVSGGWHDATDYLQYSTTSANAAWHLLAAWRDFPAAFGDGYQANGLEGKNGRADVLDEAKWGLDWLLKMHPKPDWMFNQVADDRDHAGMRLPKEDSFYGKGLERPVYFCSGQPQGLLKYKNRTTGVASTAGKFAADFALGYQLFRSVDTGYARVLKEKAFSAIKLGLSKPGVCQTAPGRSPYFYEEDNWTDDMELATASLQPLTDGPAKNKKEKPYREMANDFSKMEPVTPWLGKDTARHYQWYPFINLGHYELAKQTGSADRERLTGYYKEGIERVWNKARQNAFYRGVPFIWCSNNLTVAFAIQCYWYRELSGDESFNELEQANVDWLFGCNPWGTSMVYGLPAWGDTPTDPHSSFTHLKKYPIDGGLVDGPVYGNIYKNLIGISLGEPDEYAAFQSDLVVYHDDFGDYSTNEPTMDGTASLIYLLAAQEAGKPPGSKNYTAYQGAIIRGNTSQKRLALVFTGDEFGDGGKTIAATLKERSVKASFFLTGRFYRNPAFRNIIRTLKEQGHYLGSHSDQHLLYCDWARRDSLLVKKEQFTKDLQQSYAAMKSFGITRNDAQWFLPPYEWYNDTIAAWTKKAGLQLVNFTPGTLSTSDYTTPNMKNYRSADTILQSILRYEQSRPAGLNGFILLVHIGTDPRRTDKLYNHLGKLIGALQQKEYQFVRIDDLLKKAPKN